MKYWSVIGDTISYFRMAVQPTLGDLEIVDGKPQLLHYQRIQRINKFRYFMVHDFTGVRISALQEYNLQIPY